jgi:hypothetical protein
MLDWYLMESSKNEGVINVVSSLCLGIRAEEIEAGQLLCQIGELLESYRIRTEAIRHFFFQEMSDEYELHEEFQSELVRLRQKFGLGNSLDTKIQ